jgi:lysophospholipid acyltransferase (LPLAT)-like uncharacterized protein
MKIRSPLLNRLLARSAGAALCGLFKTLRIVRFGEADGVDPVDLIPERMIYCLWHDSILIPLTAKSRNPCPIAALVSRHRDGGHLDDFMSMLGVKSVRGSQNHGGAEAIKRLMNDIREFHVFITPDGPRGPRRVVKPGIVFLASQTGRAIIPVASTCHNAWRPGRGWTDLVIPRPFSTSYYITGGPIRVPGGIDREQLEAYRQRVQNEMDRLQVKIETAAAGHTIADCVYKRAA